MNSKIVTKALSTALRPVLRELRFTKIATRRAWRVNPDTIEVIGFHSFTLYQAFDHKCTTFSLAVVCGVHYPSAHDVLMPVTPAPEYPKETMCRVQTRLKKTIPQNELDRRDIWFVREDGSNLDEVISDIRDVVKIQGVAWLSKFADLDQAMRALEQEPEAPGDYLGGVIGSPGRRDTLRAIKLAWETLHLGPERGYEPR